MRTVVIGLGMLVVMTLRGVLLGAVGGLRLGVFLLGAVGVLVLLEDLMRGDLVMLGRN